MENNYTKQDHTCLPYHQPSINKLVAFSTNIDAMNTINNDYINEQWDMSTNNINMNGQQLNSDEKYVVINTNNTHNPECSPLEDIVTNNNDTHNFEGCSPKDIEAC